LDKNALILCGIDIWESPHALLLQLIDTTQYPYTL
jgi:hypothetical protein